MFALARGTGQDLPHGLRRPLHRLIQPVRHYRLQQVIDCAGFEGLNRVLIIGGDENDLEVLIFCFQ